MKLDIERSVKFQKSQIDYADTGFFNPIISDYLSGAEKLKGFYSQAPNIDSFGEQMKAKNSFPYRKELVDALQQQYEGVSFDKDIISSLLDKNTYTVTTGHQLCLFGGPLYFILKIVSTINTCKQLAQKYPGKRFNPVFWMASEDHDFEEANHFYFNKKKVEWESGQGGPLGRMSLVGMEDLAHQLKDLLGVGYHASELSKLFGESYLKHDNLSEATRYFVNELFGAKGVVVIDGDDPSLKKLFVPVLKDELLNQNSFQQVSSTNSELGKSYKLQVNPREINLFYLGDQLRERILKAEDGSFKVNHSNIEFSETELIEELNAHPEIISPNVILRPLYQEFILPNLAYVGGGGELAYWFQLKAVFDSYDVPFPILMLRNSVMIVNDKIQELSEKVGIEQKDLFQSELQIERKLIQLENDGVLNLDLEREELENIYVKIESKLKAIDATLEKSARSGLAKSERIVKNLEKKMFSASRKKESVMVERIERIKGELFPSGSLQERRLNFSVFYNIWGDSLIDELIEKLDPFDYRFTILSEM